MSTTQKLAKSMSHDKTPTTPMFSRQKIQSDDFEQSQVGFTKEEPYYCGITCEDTVSEDDLKFNEYLETELQSHTKNASEYDTYADDELDENNEYDECDKYYDEEYTAPTLHRKCTQTLLSWDEISVPDWDTESYLGTCSESEFAFDETVEQQTTPKIIEYDQFDIAPEDVEDSRPRPRGVHTKQKVHIPTHYEDDDEEQGYWELLPGARRFGTI